MAQLQQLQQRFGRPLYAEEIRSDVTAPSSSYGYAIDPQQQDAAQPVFAPQPLQQQSDPAQEPDAAGSFCGPVWSLIFFTMKMLFVACMLLQALLWPSVMTIIVIVILFLEMSMKLMCFTSQEGFFKSLGSYSVFFLRAGKPKVGLYIYTAALMVYTLGFFILYTSQQMREMPYMTNWIHPDYLHNYSFTESKNNEFKGMNVQDDTSKFMRDHTYTWPRTLVGQGLRINGALPHAGPGGAPLSCLGMNSADANILAALAPYSKFSCFAANLVVNDSPSPLLDGHTVTPMPSQFYTTDVMVVPPSGKACKDTEMYRIVYDSERNVDYGLDYPASAAPSSGSAALQAQKCNLFGDISGLWCLLFRHPFSEAQYKATIESKCTEGGGSLVFRLPPRSVDVEPETGRMGLDALIVTAGSSVFFRYTWHDRFKDSLLLDNWKQWSATNDDGIKTWRESTDGGAVFLRYAIAITPFLMLWYYMAVNFQQIVAESTLRQILQLCIFMLLPASVLFFVVGAWVPLGGCIACALAVNHSANQRPIRVILLLITAICNALQFSYVVAIAVRANYNAFMYEDSLRQIQDQVGGVAFISGSPTWIALVMPVMIMINFTFAMGSLTCFVYESYVLYHERKALAIDMASAFAADGSGGGGRPAQPQADMVFAGQVGSYGPG